MADRAGGAVASSGPAADDVAERVLALLRAKTSHEVRPEDSLALLEIDSVGTAELSLEIEKSLHVRVDEEIMDVETVAELIDYVRRRQAASRLRNG